MALYSRSGDRSPRRVKSPFPTGKDDYFGIFGARLRYTTVGVWATLLVVLVLLSLLIQNTKTGLAFRAITSNREGAALVGVPVSRTLTVGWAIASAIGALAAALVGGAITLNPLTMLNLLIYALAAATIGGLDSPRGAIAGGLISASRKVLRHRTWASRPNSRFCRRWQPWSLRWLFDPTACSELSR